MQELSVEGATPITRILPECRAFGAHCPARNTLPASRPGELGSPHPPRRRWREGLLVHTRVLLCGRGVSDFVWVLSWRMVPFDASQRGALFRALPSNGLARARVPPSPF